MSSSDLSELSSSPLSEDDLSDEIPKGKLEHYFKSGVSVVVPTIKKQRPPSPPHEYVLADNPDIAVRTRRVEFLYITVIVFFSRCRNDLLTQERAANMHVPIALQRCFPKVATSLRSTGYRKGRRRLAAG